MKCPNCGHNQKHKDGMQCGECRYKFVFDPKKSLAGATMTDGRFAAIIRVAGGQDAYYFTENELYTAACLMTHKRNRKVMFIATPFAALLAVIAVVCFLEGASWPASVVGMFAAFLAIAGIGGYVGLNNVPLPEEFQKWVAAWKAAERPVSTERLIDEPRLHEPPPDWSEPDIYDHGVEKIIICERDELVDWFVLNGFHAEQRALVVAESGYPLYLLPIATKLLEESPELPVFLLHDSTPEGEGMAERVRASETFRLDQHPVTDLGLFTADVQKLKRLRPLRSKQRGYALPLDAVPFRKLSVGAIGAMAAVVSLGAMIEAKNTDPSGGSFG